MTPLEKLVEAFARHAQAQTDALWRGDAKSGNKHADQCWALFDALRAHGNAGRDALAALFTHPRMDVRVSAASLLLRHRTAEAKAVLEEAAKGEGLIAFEASQVLKNWTEGTWALDTTESGAPSTTGPAVRERRARPRTKKVRRSTPARRGRTPDDSPLE